MSPLARQHNLRVLVSKHERRMVKELAESEGMTVADLVRQLIRRAHRRQFPDRHARLVKSK
jgi:hypothetical protein